jgi:anti-sigma regulatory factor (Ser/Thr protein kinase)
MSDDRLILRIANDVAELSRVAESVDLYCDANGVPADAAFNINVVLEELLMNTISYGFTDAQPHEIAVTIAKDRDTIAVEISDDGQAFDPLQAATPDLDAPLAERRIGGLGIHFVKTMMDTVEYRRADGRNHVTLRKRIVSDAG